MEPIKHLSTMATLNFTPGLTNGDMALSLGLQAGALFLKEDIGQHRQRPETHQCGRAHQLIVIPAQFFLAIAKEHFDVPTGRDMGEQGLRGGLQITGGPRAGPPTTDAR